MVILHSRVSLLPLSLSSLLEGSIYGATIQNQGFLQIFPCNIGPQSQIHGPQLIQDTHGRRLLHSSAAELSCSSSAHHCSRALRQSPVAAEQTCGNLAGDMGFLKWGYLQIISAMGFSINQPAIGIPHDLGKPQKNHDHIHLPVSASHHAMVFLGCWGTLRCVPKSDFHDFFWCQTWVPCQHSIFQCFYSWSILPLRAKTLTCRNWFWMNTTESLYTVTVLKNTGNYYPNTILKHLETACVWWKWVSQVSGCIRIRINIWTPIVGQLDSFATNKAHKKYDINIYIYIY